MNIITEDDLAGRLEMFESDKIHQINIPIEAEKDDILNRDVGDALFPEIGKDKKWMLDFKKSYTSKEGYRTWLSLFMGKPNAIEGNMFKRKHFNLYLETPAHFDRVALTLIVHLKIKKHRIMLLPKYGECTVWIVTF